MTNDTHPKPKRARRYRRMCPECGAMFDASRDQRFCSDGHKHAYHNRAMKRGKVALPLLLAARQGRGKKDTPAAWANAQLAALADEWLREDREAGRMAAMDYAAHKMRQGWRAIDLWAGK